MELDPWHGAADFAARKHAGQTRKDGVTPYVAHPVRVALVVTAVFGVRDAQTVAAALLHDTLEDTTTDYEDLEERFGSWVADAVAALTDNKALPMERRREEYHGRLRGADWRVMLVKLADVYDNLSDCTRHPEAAFRAKTVGKARRVLDLAGEMAAGTPELREAVEIVEGRWREAAGGGVGGCRYGRACARQCPIGRSTNTRVRSGSPLSRPVQLFV